MAKAEVGVKRFGRVLRIPTPTPWLVGDINSYVILPPEGGRELTLIDTGVRTAEAWKRMGEGLASEGFAIRDLTKILLTHAHPDHFGQAARIAREAGCEIWIHELGRLTFERYLGADESERIERMRAHLARWGVPPELIASVGPPDSRDVVEPFVPDRLLEDGDVIELEDFALEVHHTPGHCPEQVMFFQRETRQLFSGDHLLPDITPVCLLQLPEGDAPRPRSLLQYQASLDKADAIPARVTYPSHGDLILDHRALTRSYRVHTETRKLKFERLLREGPMTPAELGRRYFRRLFEQQTFLVMSEVIGHLDLLEEEGTAVSEEHDGLVRYRLAS